MIRWNFCFVLFWLWDDRGQIQLTETFYFQQNLVNYMQLYARSADFLEMKIEFCIEEAKI